MKPGSAHRPKPPTDVVCPNCQTLVERNYCPQCGQPVHLHDGSFFSMILHFFAHYLHYESKFLQTLKMVLFRPGAASIDFREKKRARHVEPLSLYIFVVVVYFLCSSALTSIYSRYQIGTFSPTAVAREQRAKQTRQETAKDSTNLIVRILGAEKYARFNSMVDGDDAEIAKKVDPLGPKIFFFMVPVFALLLSLSFFYKRDYSFVEHAVFSIHVHTFWFAIQLFIELFSIFPANDLIETAGLVALFLYSSVAMVRFYRTSSLYAAAVSVFSIFVYIAVLVIVFISIFLFLV